MYSKVQQSYHSVKRVGVLNESTVEVPLCIESSFVEGEYSLVQ